MKINSTIVMCLFLGGLLRSVFPAVAETLAIPSDVQQFIESSGGSTGTRGGGQELPIHFIKLISGACEQLEVVGKQFPEFKLNNKAIGDYILDCKNTLGNLKVMATNEALYITNNGIVTEVPASNDPSSNTIYLHAPDWVAINDPKLIQSGVLRQLAFHEVYSLIRLEGTGNYRWSAFTGAKIAPPVALIYRCERFEGKKRFRLDFNLKYSTLNSYEDVLDAKMNEVLTRTVVTMGKKVVFKVNGSELLISSYSQEYPFIKARIYQNRWDLPNIAFKLADVSMDPFGGGPNSFSARGLWRENDWVGTA